MHRILQAEGILSSKHMIWEEIGTFKELKKGQHDRNPDGLGGNGKVGKDCSRQGFYEKFSLLVFPVGAMESQ